MRDWRRTASEIRSGNRRALARAITMAESARPESRADADRLIDALAENEIRQSLRVGLTGAPGVGKSTLINTLGAELTRQGTKVAVLAIDPSSARTGGSILGDKTRMEALSREPLAFIRPSPSQSVLGGVAKHTREAIFLCEQAGFDVILVETTGVGQSETAVGSLTDIFLLLVAPAGGDELQGVKRGIMELADLVAVTKADGALRPIAERTCAEYRGALGLFARRARDAEGFPRAMTVSAEDSGQIMELWQSVLNLAAWRRASGSWRQIRTRQELDWTQTYLRDEIIRATESRTDVAESARRLADVVAATGTAFAPQARRELRAATECLSRSGPGFGDR